MLMESFTKSCIFFVVGVFHMKKKKKELLHNLDYLSKMKKSKI